MKAFRGGVAGSDPERNRKSQVLLAVALGATFVGAALAVIGSTLGLVLVGVGLPATVATAVWCFRNWDY